MRNERRNEKTLKQTTKRNESNYVRTERRSTAIFQAFLGSFAVISNYPRAHRGPFWRIDILHTFEAALAHLKEFKPRLKPPTPEMVPSWTTLSPRTNGSTLSGAGIIT